MKYSINFRNMKGNGDLVNHIDRRFSFAFGRMRHEVESVDITIADINGPRAGQDKQCKVVLKPSGMRKLVVTETRDNVKQAIDRGLERASQAFRRKLKRRQALRNKAVSPVRSVDASTDMMPA